MRAELYNHDEHYSTLCNWLADKAISKPNPAFLSSIGLVVDKCVIGFLYLTNSKLCIIDRVCADPKVSKEKRSEAIDNLIDGLCEIAHEQGYEMIQSWTSLPKMRKRCINLGFKDRGQHTILTRET